MRFAVGECSLGVLLLAMSERGVCAISLGDDRHSLVDDLQDQFPQAEPLGGDKESGKLLANLDGFLEAPYPGFDMPLDIQGTVFQQSVWQALRAIPVGATVTYTELAHRIGAPQSVRAVAGACAANILAVVIPCHRAVRIDGSLSGYRWGIGRKAELLRRESMA